MSHLQAKQFVQSIFRDVVLPCNPEKMREYYQPDVVARTEDITLSFDQLYEHIKFHQMNEMMFVPQFRNIMQSDNNKITAWFTQTLTHKSGTELMQLNTMINYTLKDDKLARLDFMWDKPARTVLKTLSDKPLEFEQQQQGLYSLLTKKELLCFYHLIQGKSAKQVARTMNRSPRTIETHIINIKNKLQLNTIAEIIDFALANNHMHIAPGIIAFAEGQTS